MDEPVGISFLGGFLIVVAAGALVGLLVRFFWRTTSRRSLYDSFIGSLGGFIVFFLLPMNGIAMSNAIGWQASLLVGTVLPVAVGHMLQPSKNRSS